MRRVPPRPAQERHDLRIPPFHVRSTRFAHGLWAFGVSKRITEPLANMEREVARWLH